MQKASILIRHSLCGLYPEEEIRAITRLIWEEVCGYTPIDVILHKDTILDDTLLKKIETITTRLSQGEPIQYIFGHTYFDGLKFSVTRNTLIPRPETAELVSIIAENHPDAQNILDIGTGSGCIAISLANRLPLCRIEGWDISCEALLTAHQNNNSIGTHVIFSRQDILNYTPTSDNIEHYDIIVSNPPYIIPSEKVEMERHVLDYEPHIALFAPEDDPLLFYRHIAKFSLQLLKSNGNIYFEINPLFADEIHCMLTKMRYCDIVFYQDFCNKTRFISATRPKSR